MPNLVSFIGGFGALADVLPARHLSSCDKVAPPLAAHLGHHPHVLPQHAAVGLVASHVLVDRLVAALETPGAASLCATWSGLYSSLKSSSTAPHGDASSFSSLLCRRLVFAQL